MVFEVGLDSLDLGQPDDHEVWSQLARTESGKDLLRTAKIVRIATPPAVEANLVDISQALTLGGCPESLNVQAGLHDGILSTDLIGFDGRRLSDLVLSDLLVLDNWEHLLISSHNILSALMLDNLLHQSRKLPLQLPTMRALRQLTLCHSQTRARDGMEVERAVCSAAIRLEGLRLHNYQEFQESILLHLAGFTLQDLSVQYGTSALQAVTPCLSSLTITFDPPEEMCFPPALRILSAPVWPDNRWAEYIASGALPHLRFCRARFVSRRHGIVSQRHLEAFISLHGCLTERDIVFMDQDWQTIDDAWLQNAVIEDDDTEDAENEDEDEDENEDEDDGEAHDDDTHDDEDEEESDESDQN